VKPEKGGSDPPGGYLKISASLLKQLWLDEREMRATVSEDSVFSHTCVALSKTACWQRKES